DDELARGDEEVENDQGHQHRGRRDAAPDHTVIGAGERDEDGKRGDGIDDHPDGDEVVGEVSPVLREHLLPPFQRHSLSGCTAGDKAAAPYPRRVTMRKKTTVSASTSSSSTKETAAPSLMARPRKARL